MDPDSLGDALDLSKDRSQNQVCCTYSFFVQSVLKSTQLTFKIKGAYIYQPTKTGKASGERAPKRRKTSSTNISKPEEIRSFVPLLNGEENADCVQLRYDTYKKLWSEQENKIQVQHGLS